MVKRITGVKWGCGTSGEGASRRLKLHRPSSGASAESGLGLPTIEIPDDYCMTSTRIGLHVTLQVTGGA
jgi:hypothetical protein